MTSSNLVHLPNVRICCPYTCVPTKHQTRIRRHRMRLPVVPMRVWLTSSAFLTQSSAILHDAHFEMAPLVTYALNTYLLTSANRLVTLASICASAVSTAMLPRIACSTVVLAADLISLATGLRYSVWTLGCTIIACNTYM
jgi:hypothetical protein